MIRTRRPLQAAWSHACLVLAVLAIGLRVLTPAGFMVAAPTNDLPFALVVCTGQGAMTVEPGEALPDHGGKAPDAERSQDGPCAFAGHAADVQAPNLLDVAPVEFVAYRVPAISLPLDLAPGRGLAAPPLPARGPPTLV